MLSVVVLAADVVRIMVLPSETDPVLLVHTNTVLALPVFQQELRDDCQARRPGHPAAGRYRASSASDAPPARARGAHAAWPCCCALPIGPRSSRPRTTGSLVHDIQIPCIRQLARYLR